MSKSKERAELCRYYEGSLKRFARYINPHYLYGEIHDEVFDWFQQSESDDPQVREAAQNQLLLLPRGHLKSHCIAVYAAWKITREPWTTIVYLTAGEDLATLQISAIKSMLTCPQYRLLWPEMLAEKESERDKWSTWAFNVDHPERKARGVRDYTIILKTVGASGTGLHCDVLLMDDVVVPQNAYTASGRSDVERAVGDFASIKNTGAITKAVGTRYDEKDIYGQNINAMVPIHDEETGEQIGEYKLWQIFERPVEDQGDHMGNFLWPRVRCPKTGRWEGWDSKELLKKKTEYAIRGLVAQFYAQYYNEPNKAGEEIVSEFRYYNRKLLKRSGDKWYLGDKELHVVAGMDLAWSDDTGTKSRADWSAIVVAGMDADGYIYVLDATRFRTMKYSVYYKNIAKMFDIWRFKSIFIESDGAGKVIIEEIKNMVRQNNLSVHVAGKAQSRKLNAKAEEHAAVLEPRYSSGTILHYKGGIIADLEEEVKTIRPKFDDLKDALTKAAKNLKKPGKGRSNVIQFQPAKAEKIASRFGGRR